MQPTAPLLNRLRLPVPVPVRDVWPSEPAHFTPWLAEHLDLLEPLDLGGLELVETEVRIPGTGRALDILARLPTGDLVAIENQFESADHDHLTRGLAYAVGLNAVALVLVAESHLDEFRAVASYLNAVAERSDAEQQIRVYLVGLAAERVEDFVVPRLTVIESPNPWVQAVNTSKPGPAMGSVAEFLTGVPEAAQEAFSTVTDWWTSAPTRSIRYGAKNAISLDRPHPSKAGEPSSAMTLNLNGTSTVNRGYLLESGAVPAERLEEFDAMLRSSWPDLRWSGKYYYLSSTGPPDLASVQALVEWLDRAGGDVAKPNSSSARAAPSL